MRYSLKETEARDLLEIIEARHKVASTIFCSQFSVRGWQDKIGDGARLHYAIVSGDLPYPLDGQ